MTSNFYSHPNHNEVVDYVRFAYPNVDINNFNFVCNSDSSLGFDKCSASFLPTTTSQKIHSTWRCYHKAKRSERFDTKYRPCGGVIKCDVCGFVKNHTSKQRTCCGQNLSKISCPARLIYVSVAGSDGTLIFLTSEHNHVLETNSVDNQIQTGARSLRSDTESNRGIHNRYVDTNEGGFLQEGGFVRPETKAEINLSENIGHVVCSFSGDVRAVSLSNLNLAKNNCNSILVDEQGFLRVSAHGNTHDKPPSEYLQPSAEIVDDSCLPDVAQDSGGYVNVSSVCEISEAKVEECENSIDQSGKLKSHVENTLNSAIPGCTSKSDICNGTGFNVNSFYSKHRRT